MTQDLFEFNGNTQSVTVPKGNFSFPKGYPLQGNISITSAEASFTISELFVIKSGTVTIKDFELNSDSEGDAFFILSPRTKCRLEQGVASIKTTWLVEASEAEIEISKLELKNSYGGVYLKSMSTATVTESNFSGNKKVCILSKSGSQLKIENCSFSKNKSQGIALKSSKGVLVRCDFSDNEAASVSSNESESRIEHCKFNNGSDSGIRSLKSQLSVYHCLFTASQMAAILARDSSTLDVKHSHFKDGKQGGIFISSGGSALIEYCRFDHNQRAAIVAVDQTHVTFNNSSVTGTADHGVLIQQSKLVMMDSQVAQNHLSGINSEDAAVEISQSKIWANQKNGVFLHGRCEAEIKNCSFSENNYAGAGVRGGSILKMEHCRLQKGNDYGILCYQYGSATLTNCVIAYNKSSGAAATTNGKIRLKRCLLAGNHKNGLFLEQDASGDLQKSTAKGNRYSALAAQNKSFLKVVRCNILSGVDNGVQLKDQAVAEFQASRINENQLDGIIVMNSRLQLNYCEVMSNAGNGIRCLENSAVSTRRTTIIDNKLSEKVVDESSKLKEHTEVQLG